VTCVLAGKKTWVPTTSHTDLSFSIEHYYSDLALSEVFTGCKVSQMDVQLPATGMAKIGLQFMGKDMVADSAEYFTSPTAETTTGVLAAVNGKLYVGGAAVATVTGMNFTVNGNMSTEPVVGSNTATDIFEGRVTVSGRFTALFESATFRDMFDDETEAALVGVFTTSNDAAADFLAFNMPRIKVGSADKDDGEKGIVQTLSFTSLYNSAGGPAVNSQNTTISIQDSTA
jgi:hypothetical protein